MTWGQKIAALMLAGVLLGYLGLRRDTAPEELERIAFGEEQGPLGTESVRWLGRLVSIYDEGRQYGVQRSGLFFATRLERAPDFQFLPGDVVEVRGRITGRTRFGAVYVAADSIRLIERVPEIAARALRWVHRPRPTSPAQEYAPFRPFPSLPGIGRPGQSAQIGVPDTGGSRAPIIGRNSSEDREALALTNGEDEGGELTGADPTLSSTASEARSYGSTGTTASRARRRPRRHRKPGGGPPSTSGLVRKGEFGLWRVEWGRMARPSSPNGGSL